MAAQTISEVADPHWSSTSRTLRAEVVDQFFEDYGTIDELRKSSLSIIDTGGRGIEIKLQTSGNTAASFSHFDTLNKAPINPIESATFTRRYYYCPIILSDTDSWENSGEAAIFDEMEALRNNAMQSLLKAINEDCYTAQAGKNMLGFPDLIADASGATIGGIDSSATTVWDNQRDTNATTFLTQTATNIFNGVDKWSDLLDSILIQGASKKGRIFTTWGIAKAYRIALSSQGYARTTVESVGGIGGEYHPSFYDYRLIPDNDCTALHSYFVPGSNKNNAGVTLNILRQVNFKKTPFVSLQSNGQLAQLAYMVAGVQLTTNRRRQNAVGTAITGT